MKRTLLVSVTLVSLAIVAVSGAASVAFAIPPRSVGQELAGVSPIGDSVTAPGLSSNGGGQATPLPTAVPPQSPSTISNSGLVSPGNSGASNGKSSNSGNGSSGSNGSGSSGSGSGSSGSSGKSGSTGNSGSNGNSGSGNSGGGNSGSGNSGSGNSGSGKSGNN